MATTRQTRKHDRRTMKTLAVDVGGTGIKAIVLDEKGSPLTERGRIPTPKPASPSAVTKTIVELAKGQGEFDRVSVGFPGVIRHGIVYTAPNLGNALWKGFNLVSALTTKLQRPVRAANDADVQGFGAIRGKDIELVITLGTGFGSALFVDGKLVPNLELGHHPFRDGETYEEQLGEETLKKIGKKKWNKRLEKAIETLDLVLNFDHLYIGGGNSKKVTLTLPEKVTLVPNTAGLLGGIAFWNLGADDPMNRWIQAKPSKTKSPKSKSKSRRKTIAKG
ncbi:MAG: ROK family protein [Nitrospirales bacterium]|nr:ROK family protein [Nitrospira sp.]MDR4501641.1 ROK family protein [Nitrospirales bacterium]